MRWLGGRGGRSASTRRAIGATSTFTTTRTPGAIYGCRPLTSSAEIMAGMPLASRTALPNSASILEEYDFTATVLALLNLGHSK